MFKTEILGKQFTIDFDEKSISVNDKKMLVEDSDKYTYKLLKRKIYAHGGAPGLYNYLTRCKTAYVILWVYGQQGAIEAYDKKLIDTLAIQKDKNCPRAEALALLENGAKVYTPDEFINTALEAGFYKPDFDFDYINGLTFEEFKQEVTAGTFQADGVHSVQFGASLYYVDYCIA